HLSWSLASSTLSLRSTDAAPACASRQPEAGAGPHSGGTVVLVVELVVVVVLVVVDDDVVVLLVVDVVLVDVEAADVVVELLELVVVDVVVVVDACTTRMPAPAALWPSGLTTVTSWAPAEAPTVETFRTTCVGPV